MFSCHDTYLINEMRITAAVVSAPNIILISPTTISFKRSVTNFFIIGWAKCLINRISTLTAVK